MGQPADDVLCYAMLDYLVCRFLLLVLRRKVMIELLFVCPLAGYK